MSYIVVTNTIQPPEHVNKKSQGRLMWSQAPEADQKILTFNLHSRYTEVSFWSNLFCDLRLAEGLTSILALPILIVWAQRYLSRLIFFFFQTKRDHSSVSIFLSLPVGMHIE